jgi:hypothetical protein
MLRAGDSIQSFSASCHTDNMLYKLFREKPCVDMTSFELNIEQCDELYDHVMKTIHPLRLGMYVCMYVQEFTLILIYMYSTYKFTFVFFKEYIYMYLTQ